MTVISTQIPERLYSSLSQVAKQLDRSKSYLIREALEIYLQELLKGVEDCSGSKKLKQKNLNRAKLIQNYDYT
ncbi:Putative ribbon-helix-helix domain containing protein [Candidatus Trichorickettsia mobilis]|uniref:Ribbon-helix-helix domain containing protein n=1 Tax=Candidatus Trichorickettsia mobilis TaxID=1346319 RepID=A0ABZ0USS6_9RICK|nr:ribbon-helix-helix domain-containing protein [Candidatus Trichorickettsia mobilis]WPY00861.1 Putative ribbon-helix-helix domain containing protein [Candidatus Trichorickettsia mobilis]